MSQNIDSFMSQIKSEGPQQINVKKCIDLNHLHYIRQRVISKQRVEETQINQISSKCQPLCENILFQELIAEIIIDQRNIQESKSNLIIDFKIGKEIQKQFKLPKYLENQQLYLEYFDLQYTAKLKFRLTSPQDRDYTIQLINNYIFWILLYHDSYEKSQQIKQSKIKNDSSQSSLIQTTQNNIKSLQNLAHITINQIPEVYQQESSDIINSNIQSEIQTQNQQKDNLQSNISSKNKEVEGQFLIVIGFNTKRSEVFYFLERFREFNYSRNKINEYLIPSYNSTNLCLIIYHYFLVFRKILKFQDSNLYDAEIKTLISTNFDQISQDPTNSDTQLKLDNFNECHFQIFEFNSSSQYLDRDLSSYQFRKFLIINLIETLDVLCSANVEDLAFNILSDNNKIITCFQYNIKKSDVENINLVDAFNTIINRIQKIIQNEKIEFSAKSQRYISPKKQAVNIPSNINKQFKPSIDIKSTLQTAFSWFDNQKYSMSNTSSKITNSNIKSEIQSQTEKNKEFRGSSYFGTLQ